MLRMRPLHWCRLAAFAALAAANAANAATIVVTSLADVSASDGVCTLREAITAANTDAQVFAAAGECAAGTAGLDVIEFAVAGTIKPTSELPLITTPIHLNGYSAPGAKKNTLPLTQGNDAVLAVELDGVDAGNAAGLRLSGAGASGSIVEGFVINNSANPTCCAQIGIYLNGVTGAATTIIRGNFIGTDVTGTVAQRKGAAGIGAFDDVRNLVIGSGADGPVDAGARNVVVGTTLAIGLTGRNITIRGNYIGSDATGTVSLSGFANGIGADSMIDSLIADNLISGNGQVGISARPSTANLTIRNNLIGTDAAGTGALPNGSAGIFLYDNPNVSNTKLSNVDIADNVIAHNRCFNCSGGVALGVISDANSVLGVRLARNLIYDNAGLQIDIFRNDGNRNIIYGVDENDPLDPDTGPNARQNFPVLSPATGNGTTISVPFALDSEAGKTFRIEFFQTPKCDASGHGGANVYLGAAEVVTDGTGKVSGTANLASVLSGGYVTATATEAVNGTSEFSLCVVLSKDGGTSAPLNIQGSFWNFPAASEAGWGINFSHQGDIVFATWFTYGPDRKPLWFAAELHLVSPGVYTGNLFTTTGPPLSAVPWDPTTVKETTVGTMTVTFTDADNATFSYTVGKVSQSKAITRQLFSAPVPTCVFGAYADLALATGYQDLWWRYPPASEAGWGANFTQQGNIIFVTWFTYGADGQPLWLIAVAERNAEGVFTGPISTVTGPPFSAQPWETTTVVETVVGTLTITFVDGNRASFDYTVNGITQSKEITRQVFIAPGTVCVP